MGILAMGLGLCGQAGFAQSGAETQDPTVTFYGGGHLFDIPIVGTKSQVFYGSIFDNGNLVATVSYRGFVVVRLRPGKHVFSASLSAHHPAENSQLPMTLVAGKDYFVRGEIERKGDAFFNPLDFHPNKGRLDVVPCGTAHEETKRSRFMGQKYVAGLYKAQVVLDIPACAPVVSP
jgi:hypothetical protein